MASAPEVEFDHHSEAYADGWPEQYAAMRSACPVSHTSAWGGFYPLTSYDAVTSVVRDDATFSSQREVEGVAPHPFGLGITIPGPPTGNVPIDLDPPHNEPYRKLLNPLFSPKSSRAWEPFIREATTACIDRFVERGSGDFVLDVANPVPGLLTCELMGLPLEDWRTYAEPMHEIVYTQPGTPEYDAVVLRVFTMIESLAGAIAERREHPREDLISTLVQAEVDGAPLPDDTILEMLNLVLVGGVDTTTSLMANAFHWLGRHPEVRDRLRADPSLWPVATEEFLRYYTPTQALARTVKSATEVAGVPLSVGDRVLMCFAAANRDPAVFPDPDTLDIDRDPAHVAFGLGVHRCLGSNIARYEFSIAMQEVLRRMPDYVVDESASRRYGTIGIVNGWEAMPFTFTPGAVEGSSLVF